MASGQFAKSRQIIVAIKLKRYTVVMRLFVNATKARAARTAESGQIVYLYAGLLVIFAVAQLFTFEEFVPLINQYGLVGGEVFSRLVASVLVSAEVLALPFLLGLRVSSLMRWFSLGLAIAVPIIWLGLALVANITRVSLVNVGYLGTKVHLVSGAWTIFFSLALLILAVWSAWALWPGKRK